MKQEERDYIKNKLQEIEISLKSADDGLLELLAGRDNKYFVETISEAELETDTALVIIREVLSIINETEKENL